MKATSRRALGLALLLAGCAIEEGRMDTTDGGPLADAGVGRDGAPSTDASAPPLLGETPSADSSFAGCLDGDDADHDFAVDCADLECERAPSCCVAATTTACCGAPLTLLDSALSACGASCAGIASASFGTLRTDAEGFHPGTADADSGFVLDLPLDAREGTLTLRATITAPISSRALDLVTFGFSTDDAGAARVLPLVAVQVNAATRRVALLVGETVVESAPLVGEAPTMYSLELAPNGVATLSGGANLSTTGVPALGLLRPVLYGRTEDAAASASIESLAVLHQICDVPSALDPVAITLVDDAGVFVPGSEANPSLARDGTGTRFLAFDALRVDDPTRRGVFIAREVSALRFVVENPSAAEAQPVITSVDVEEFVDPELVFDGTRWVLYTAGDANGMRSIFRASSTTGLAFGAPMEILIDGDHGSLDSPSTFAGAGDRLLARETDSEGATRIVELRFAGTAAVDEAGAFADAICGVDDICESPTSRDTRYILTERGGTSFDAEEVDAPSMVRVGGVYRLYYAGRRGNRWATGLVVSEDGAYWRRISDTARAPDVVIGVDATLAPLGARSASVTVEGTTLTVVYEGFRGTRSAILIAEQSL